MTFKKENLEQLPASVRQQLMDLKRKHRRGVWFFKPCTSQRICMGDRAWGKLGKDATMEKLPWNRESYTVDLADEHCWLVAERQKWNGYDLTVHRGLSDQEAAAEEAQVEVVRGALLEHRRAAWTAEVAPVADNLSMSTGEFEVSITHNGSQWHTETFTVEEWDRLSQAVEAYRASRIPVAVSIKGGVRHG